MEELQNSHLRNRTGVSLSRKIPNGNAQSGYDDVFGGPPRFSAPFATRFDDYAEIFGGLSSSCSIPVLDLPPAIDGGDAPVDARSSGFDYSEIFGGFDAGAFAISYEELFSVPKRPEDPSSNERVSKETDSSQQVKEISEFSSEGPSEDHIAYSETDQISSDSHYSNDGSKQFNMSYHKTSRGSKEDVINGTTHVTQLHAVPGFTFLVDACSPLQKITSDNPPEMATNDTSFSVNLNGGVTDGRKWNIFPPTSSGASTNSSENDLKADQKQFPTKHPTSGDGLANVNRHSRSSSNQSASSGDIPNPDGTFVSVFDISLRTQPLRVPPPSRPPPKLVTKHGHTKNNSFANPKNGHDEERLCRPMTNHQTQYSGSASKSHTIQDAVKDSSPQFFDVEVDASSAAAASAAAMKEAMEQAQARLKSAKESMERKRDNLKSHKNLGHREGVKGKERKEDRAAHEVQSIPEETAQKIFEKEDRKMNDFTMEERQKAKREAKVASDHEDKDRHLVSAEEDRQTVQGKESRSSQVSNKLERAGEWKIDNQFYELINNEKKFKTVQEVSEQEGSEKKLKKMTKVNEDKGNESKVTKLANESKDNGRSCVGNEACEWKENDKELKAGNLAGSEEEIKEIAKAIPEACVQEENDNKLEDAIDSYQREDNEKTLKEAREARFCEVEEKKSDAAEEACADGEREIKLKTSNEACKLEEAHEHEEEEKKSEAVKKARGCEKEPNATFEAPQSEKKLKRANKAIMQDEDEKVFEVLHGSWMFEVREKMKASQEASQYVDFEKTRGVSKLAYDREENENELKATNVATEQEESKKLNGIPEAYGWVENEKKLRVAQEAVELEENEKKSKATKVAMGHTENKANLKAAQEAVGDAEDKKKLQAAKQDCQQDCNEKKASEAQLELLQNEKKSKAANVPCDLENSEKKLTTAEGDYGQRENGSFKEVRGALDSEKNNNRFITTQDECQMVESEGLEPFREDFALDEKGNRLALDATKSCGTGATDSTVPDMPKSAEREKEGRMEREREREKELARKLEEEKEREREREKDRLAVERATREARERALSEARERAERIAVERVTAEARQRALAEAREKAEKASAEALEKSIAEKATREARLRAERAAVERATAEARERAVERAMAEKVASEARERAERFSSTSRDRMRKDNEAEGYFRASDKEDSGTRLKPSSSDFQDVAQFQSTGFSSSNSHRYSDSHNQASYSNGKLEGTENESALRCKARLERHQRTVERAAKALAEKNIRDILAQREQAERNRLAESLDADVRRWSNGKEGNLRALLSTLQYILGSESGWQPIPLTDVITAAAVKKAYRKATLCVHPDKLQQRGASIQQKYICEKVFDLLKEAWNRFNSEER